MPVIVSLNISVESATSTVMGHVIAGKLWVLIVGKMDTKQETAMTGTRTEKNTISRRKHLGSRQ